MSTRVKAIKLKSRHTEKVREWVRKRIQRMEPGEQFPTIAELVSSFNLSGTTIKRVLKPFRDRGEIVGVPGKGMFKAGDTRRNPEVGAPRSSAQRIRDHLFGLISGGRFKRGEALPPVKTICYQFHVSPATVIAAYRMLVREGLVEKVGKTFWVGSFEGLVRPKHRRKIYFVWDSEYSLEQLFRDGFNALSYRKLQSELIFHGFTILYVGAAELRSLLEELLKSRENVQGFFFLQMSRDCFTAVRRSLDPYLMKAKKLSGVSPSIVVEWKRGQHGTVPAGTREFMQGHLTTSTARELARLVASMHPPRVVFFTASDHTIWKSGWSSSLLKVRNELKHLSEKIETRFVVRTPESAAGEAGNNVIDVKHIEENTRNWFYKYGRHSIEDILTGEVTVTGEFHHHYRLEARREVWVFSRDRDAREATSWASFASVDIPGRLALISLENSPDFFHFNITTCAPDWDTIGYMLAHALIGDFQVATTSKGFIASSAQILRRLTTP